MNVHGHKRHFRHNMLTRTFSLWRHSVKYCSCCLHVFLFHMVRDRADHFVRHWLDDIHSSGLKKILENPCSVMLTQIRISVNAPSVICMIFRASVNPWSVTYPCFVNREPMVSGWESGPFLSPRRLIWGHGVLEHYRPAKMTVWMVHATKYQIGTNGKIGKVLHMYLLDVSRCLPKPSE